MRTTGMALVGFLAFAALIVPNTPAMAEPAGKIYVGDSWVEAETKSLITPAQNTFLGDLFGQAPSLSVSQLVKNFLRENASILNFDRETAWGIVQTIAGEELETQRVNKTWRGLPVIGGDAVIHLSRGQLAFANADATALRHLATQARVRGEEAQAVAFASYQGSALHATAPELKVLVNDFGRGKEARLVYEITVRDRNQFASDIHYIDALNAEELLVSTNVHTFNNRQVLAGNGEENDFALEESTWKVVYSGTGCTTSPGQSTGPTSPDRFASVSLKAPPAPCNTITPKVMASAKAAWANSGLVHEYFQTTHRRNSIDNKGMALKSVVNFGGDGFPNAAWYNDKSLMLYGLGDETTLNDFASPLDVAAHEITHGVTSRTSNLAYVAESGALNESYSDVFGKLVAFKNNRGTDWKLGRDLFKDGVSFIRDMENPEIGHTRDFKHRGQQCSRINNFCGVHTNSGIPNRAAVLLAKRIGNDKLGKLYYLTLTQLLRSNSNFKEAKAQTEAACATLFGAGSQDCKAVTESFAAVGI